MTCFYSLDVPNAAQVVANAIDRSTEYEDHNITLGTVTMTLEYSFRYSELVQFVLAEYLESSLIPDSESVFDHTSTTITHTTNAIVHYVNGDEEMCSANLSALSTVATPDIPGIGAKK